MSLFKILWGVDAVAAAIVLYFFVIGLADKTVSQRNMGFWFGIIFLLIIIMGGSIWLRWYQYHFLSIVILSVLAIPALVYLVFILMAMAHKGRWN